FPTRQWSWVSDGLRPQDLWRLPTAALDDGIPRDRSRARHGPAHHPPPRRSGLGRGRARKRRLLLFQSPRGNYGKEPMNSKYILLVEDNPDDVKLTQRAFKKWNIANEM